jgi:hypothetical protein
MVDLACSEMSRGALVYYLHAWYELLERLSAWLEGGAESAITFGTWDKE